MEGNERLIGANGTDGVISLLVAEEWVIGYLDAGSALSEGLREIALKVEGADLRSDFFLTAENSLRKDGVAAALLSEGTNIPTSGDADWSGVDPVNQVAVSSFKILGISLHLYGNDLVLTLFVIIVVNA